jgi:glycosyltransferase involved in cell wall biosynthesis
MISLIVATWNRVAEPAKLLQSLEQQTYRDFEVILADQNEDDRLLPVIASYPTLKIKHLRMERGLSKARNIALKSAQGDLISFPDDDCWYPTELLAEVVRFFEEHPGFSTLLTATRNEKGQLMAPKFPPTRGPRNRFNVLKCVVTFNAFVKAEVVQAIGFFREDIGPGTSSPYQSSEDTDYLIRPVEQGFPTWYEPGLSVYHPDFHDLERLATKGYGYALGQGHILRSHGYPLWVIGDALARSLCGAAVFFCKGKFTRAKIYALRAKGQFQGYFGTKVLSRTKQ